MFAKHPAHRFEGQRKHLVFGIDHCKVHLGLKLLQYGFQQHQLALQISMQLSSVLMHLLLGFGQRGTHLCGREFLCGPVQLLAHLMLSPLTPILETLFVADLLAVSQPFVIGGSTQ